MASIGVVMPDKSRMGTKTKMVIIPTWAWFRANVAANKPMPAVEKTYNTIMEKYKRRLPRIGTPKMGRSTPKILTLTAPTIISVMAKTFDAMM